MDLGVWKKPLARIGRRVLLNLAWLVAMCFVAVAVTALSVWISTGEVGRVETASSLLSSLAGGLIGAAATVISLDWIQSARASKARRAGIRVGLLSRDQARISALLQDLRESGELGSGYLDGMRLDDVELVNQNLSGMRLARASLVGADLRGSDLSSADFRSSDFTDADLTETRGLHCDLRGCKTLRTVGIPLGVRQ